MMKSGFHSTNIGAFASAISLFASSVRSSSNANLREPNEPHGTPPNQLSPIAAQRIHYDHLSWLIVAANVVTQLIRYFQCHGLRYDECRVALNLLERDYRGLTGLLDYQQSAPIAFLWIEKLSITAGHNEYLFRLFPLLMGVIAPVLFRVFMRREASPRAALIGTCIFCLNCHILSYSSELKQYSLDVTCAIIVLMVGAWVIRTQITPAKIISVAVLGAIAFWFSHPEILIVAAVWCAVAGATMLPLWKTDVTLRLRTPIAVGMLTLGSAILLANFMINYKFVIAPLVGESWPTECWGDSFAPYPPWTLDDLRWYLTAASDLMSSNHGETYWGLLLVPFFLAGLLYVFCTRPWLALMLALPILLAFVASALKRFGFADRQILFLQPSVIFLSARGIEQIVRLISERRSNLEPIAAWGITAFCMVAPFYALYSGTLDHWNQLATRPALTDLTLRLKKGDVIYLTQSMSYNYLYYAPLYRMTDAGTLAEWPGLFTLSTRQLFGHEGTEPSGYESEIQQAIDKHPESHRIWVLTATVSWLDYADVRPSMRSVLEKRGTLEEFTYPGVTTFLLTLAEAPTGSEK